MENETRSLWEIYDSETEPWKKGRTILVLIGLFYFITQVLIFVAATFVGNLEQAVIFAVNAVLFWFVFYLIWVGVHWLRWVCGAWNLVLGFCLIIWGWRDANPVGAILGCICFIIGVCFCLSPSVYVFALRQRKSVRWKEAGLIAAVCFLAVISLGTALVGLGFLHQQRVVEAARFGDEAVRRIYNDRDMEWALAHVSARSLQDHGQERMRYFLGTIARLGNFEQISNARAIVRMGLQLPARFITNAEIISDAKATGGSVELHALVFDAGRGWEIERMWWTVVPSADNSSRNQ